MRRSIAAAVAALAVVAPAAITPAANASAGTWNLIGTNQVASSPTSGGGYPIPAGSRVPDAGTCRSGPFNSNHSESWLAVKPGTENLVGSSKFFFDKFSTFYMFYLGAHQILNGIPSGNNQIQGYDCLSTGTQNMPPSWTDTTDPNLDFDTKGRVYQVMLPFNAFWDASRLHPDGEIDVSFSDDMGNHWVKGNRGQALEPPNNASARQAGHVEDKQWIAVNHIVGSPNQDHVYAAWAVFNGSSNGAGTKVRLAVSRDRGETFAKAVTISPPSQVGAAATFVYPSIDAVGDLYVAVVSFPPNGGPSTIFVTRSTDGSAPVGVNDNVDAAGVLTDQFQPEVAAGPGGAVAIEFYDRRQACPNDASVLAADVGRTNFCIDVSLQAYNDSGSGALSVGTNRRVTQFAWDPEQPGQHLGGLSQYPCTGARDPCPNGRGFIGDYFGLAISATNIYSLFVSTHYPSNVTGDEGGLIYYQQQVLGTVDRAALGI